MEAEVLRQARMGEASCRDSCWVYGAVRRFRDRLTPAQLLGLDVLVIAGAWVLTGTLTFFYSAQKSIQAEFTLAYSFYYACNIGLGVGSAPYQPTLGPVAVFECLFCMAGNCLVVGGLGAYYKLLSETADRHRIAGKERRVSKICAFGAAYAVAVAYGCLVGAFAAGYSSVADLFVFSVTNLQTSGLLVGKYENLNWSMQGCFLLIGIPVAALFMAEICDHVFCYHERATEHRRASLVSPPDAVQKKPLLEAREPAAPSVSVRRDVLGFLEDLAAAYNIRPAHEKGAPESAKARAAAAAAANADIDDSACCFTDCDEMPRLVRTRWRAWHAFRSTFDPLHVLAMDLCLCVGLWLGTGTMWFAFFQMDQGWSAAYSVYYAVNVGMGVGSAERKATGDVTLWFEVFYCITGSALVVGGVGLTFRVVSDRAKRVVAPTAMEKKPRALARFKIWGFSPTCSILGAAYVTMMAAGCVIAYYCCGFRRSDDLFIWSITNMTTAGLLVSQHGEPHYHMYAFTAAFMMVAIPTSSVFFAEVASEVFDYHEKAVVNRRMSLIYGATRVSNLGADHRAEEEVPEAPSAAFAEVKDDAGDRAGHTTVDREYLEYLEDLALRSGAVDAAELERKKAEGAPVAEEVVSAVSAVQIGGRSYASSFAAVEGDDTGDSDDGARAP